MKYKILNEAFHTFLNTVSFVLRAWFFLFFLKWLVLTLAVIIRLVFIINYKNTVFTIAMIYPVPGVKYPF